MWNELFEKSNGFRVVLVSLLLLSGEAGAQVPADATEPDPDPDPKVEAEAEARQTGAEGGIEVVRVTAEKRSATVQETPIAISAFTGADLQAAGIQNVAQLAYSVPSFHFGQALDGAKITIRGVSQTAGDQATAFHIDGVYQNNPLIASSLTYYDLARIEVLRGPQGTFFGRNSTAGAMNVVSRAPTYDFEAFGDVMVGSYDTLMSRGAFNVPIVDERVALRFAVFQEVRDGFQRNLDTPVRNFDADDARNYGMRGQLRLDPLDDLRITIRGTFDHVGGVGVATKREGELPDNPIFAGASPNPSDPREIYKDTPGSVDVDQWGLNSTVAWDYVAVPLLGEIDWTLIGSYLEGGRRQVNDADLTDLPILLADTRTSNREWTLDTHVKNSAAGRFEWILGAFYFGARSTIDIEAPTTIGAFPTLDVTQFESRNANSAAGYGQGTLGFLDGDLRFTLGLRYSADWKDGRARDSQVDFGPLCVLAAVESEDEDDWGGLTGVARAEYRFAPAHMAYASASRGYKAGTIEHPVPIRNGCDLDPPTIDVPNAEPESIWAIEAGSKNRFADDRVQANLTGFYYRYHDLQIGQIVDSVIVTQNADEARIFGIELETVWMPLDALRISANFSYLNTRFTDFVGFVEEDPSEPVDFSGNRLPRAPEFSATIAGSYEIDLARYGSLTPRVQSYLSSDLYFRPANEEVDRQKAYTRTDVRLFWRSADDGVWVEGFVENVEGADVLGTRLIGAALLDSPPISAYQPPRTWGVRLGLDW